jgi:hypothetical protein
LETTPNAAKGKSFSVPDSSESEMDLEDDYASHDDSDSDPSVQEVSPWQSPIQSQVPDSFQAFQPTETALLLDDPESDVDSDEDSHFPSDVSDKSDDYDEDFDDDEDGDEEEEEVVGDLGDANMNYYTYTELPTSSKYDGVFSIMDDLNSNVSLVDVFPTVTYSAPAGPPPPPPPPPPPVQTTVEAPFETAVKPKLVQIQDLSSSSPRQAKMDISSLISSDDSTVGAGQKRSFDQIVHDIRSGTFEPVSPTFATVAARQAESMQSNVSQMPPKSFTQLFVEPSDVMSAPQSYTNKTVTVPQTQTRKIAPLKYSTKETAARGRLELLSVQEVCEARKQAAAAAAKPIPIVGASTAVGKDATTSAEASSPAVEETARTERGEPARKRSRIGDLALGVLIGGITTVAALASLPENFFA